jgi:hypothetical protein
VRIETPSFQEFEISWQIFCTWIATKLGLECPIWLVQLPAICHCDPKIVGDPWWSSVLPKRLPNENGAPQQSTEYNTNAREQNIEIDAVEIIPSQTAGRLISKYYEYSKCSEHSEYPKHS